MNKKTASIPNQLKPNHENWHEFPYQEFYKWSADGKTVYLRREFEDGQSLYFWFDIDDPGENGAPTTRRAYLAVRGEEALRY